MSAFGFGAQEGSSIAPRALALLCVGIVTLMGLWLGASDAQAHPGHEHLPNGGRLAGQPDYQRFGKTTWRFLPGKGEYEIKRQGQSPSFAHVDPVPTESQNGVPPGTAAAEGGAVPLPGNELAPICRTSGNRIVVVYSHRSSDGTPTPTATLRSIVQRMNWKINDQSSLSSGGSRAVKMLVDCSGSGEINVYNITTASYLPGAIEEEAKKLFGTPSGTNAVKYLIFDHEAYPGASGLAGKKTDETKSPTNLNATTTGFAYVYNYYEEQTWKDHTPVHEFFHTLGATQGSSGAPPPFSTPSHCTDGLDVMCYNDKSFEGFEYDEARCPVYEGYETPAKVPLDCGNDTYFDAAPTPGSWLDKHWNLAGQENPFLIVPGPPKATTLAASPVKDKTATVWGVVNPEGYETSYRFEYGTTKSYGTSVPIPNEGLGFGTAALSVSKGISGLQPVTNYHYRVVATNSAGTANGADETFLTKGAPTVTTSNATVLGTFKATLHGTINPNQASTSYRFEYGTSESYGADIPVSDGNVGSGKTSVDIAPTISGLSPNTTYHLRLRAQNEFGTTYSTDRTFRTHGKAAASTEAAANVSWTGATLKGSINPEGFHTSYQFEYGPTTGYGQSVPASSKYVGSGTEAVVVSQQLDGLEAEATYHFRVKATSAEGTSYGQDREFTTAVAPSFDFAFGSQGWGDGQFVVTPWPFRVFLGIATDPEGNVWVADTGNHRVQEFSSEGEYLDQFGSEGSGNGEFLFPTDVATDPEGNVWVTDTGNSRIQKFSSEGEYLGQFGSVGSGAGEFVYPEGIATDPEGNVWVADTGNNRIQKFSPEGEHIAQFGSWGAGAGDFTEPDGIATDPEGNVWVADAGNGRIQKFSSEGEYLDQSGSHGSGSGEFDGPAGIATDPEGNVWVADTGNNRVQEFDHEGRYLAQFGSKGSGEGQFDLPTAVATDPEGNVWVADANARLQKWRRHLGPPTVAAKAASGLSAHGATVKAMVNPHGSATTYQFEYGKTTAYGTTAPVSATDIGSGTADVAVSKTIEGLKPSTTYHFRALARSSGGLTAGEDGTFTTSALPPPPTAPPGVSTGAASKVSASGATLNAMVNPEGASTIYQFEYGKTTAYGSKVPASPKNLGSGTNSIAVNEQLEGLQVETTYHFRVKAVNSLGTSYGKDRKFKVNAMAPVFSLAAGSKGSGNGQFNNPSDVATDSEGNVWVADYNNSRIQKLSPEGKYLGQFGSYGSGNGQLDGPWAIAIDPEGDVWVADAGNYRVQQFNSKGEYLSQFDGEGNGEFSVPMGIAVDSEGDIWIVDTLNYRVQEFDSEGQYLDQFGEAGSEDGHFYYPMGIAADPEGNIWVADLGNNRVQKFSPEGEYLSQIGTGGYGNGELNSPEGIEVGPEGEAWVADTANNRVQKFSPVGGYLSQFGSKGSNNGQLSNPAAVAIDPKGYVWVADSGNNRIQKWRLPASPVVANKAVSGVGLYGATLNATINPKGAATTYQFEYGTSTSYGGTVPVSPASAGSGIEAVSVSKAIEGLKPSTTYHFRIVASSELGEATSDDWAFTTAGLPPALSTGAASGVDAHGATLNATVNPRQEGTDYRFEYGTTTSYGSTAPTYYKNIAPGVEDIEVSEPIEGLKPATAYHFRIVATSSGGSAFGEDATFVTSSVPPVATTEGAAVVEPDGAMLNGMINPEGPDTHYQFEYGSTTAYGTSLPAVAKDIGSGTENVVVYEQLKGLEPEATYHFRIKATSASGTAYGDDQEFKTSPIAPEFEFAVGSGGSGNGELENPSGVAADSNGDIWVADTYNNRIQRFSPEGKYLGQFGEGGSGDGQLEAPAGIGIDSNGDIWVADTYNNRIQRFSPEGKYLGKFGTEGEGNGQLSLPFGIAIDSEDKIWVADTYNNRIQQFDPSGAYLSQFGGQGAEGGQLSLPFGIAIDSEDKIWVADTYNNRIQQFSPEGEYLSQFEGEFTAPFGIAADAEGDVWVAGAGNNRIQELSPGGEYLAHFGSPGSANGELNSPLGIAIDVEGDFWIADTGNDRIQKWSY